MLTINIAGKLVRIDEINKSILSSDLLRESDFLCPPLPPKGYQCTSELTDTFWLYIQQFEHLI